MNKYNISLKFRVQVINYKLSRTLKDLKYKIKHSRYNNDIEYIKNVMESIISIYE